MTFLLSMVLLSTLPGEAPPFITLTPQQQERVAVDIETAFAERGSKLDKDFAYRYARAKRAVLEGRAFADEPLKETALLDLLHCYVMLQREVGEAGKLELTIDQQKRTAATAAWLLDYFQRYLEARRPDGLGSPDRLKEWNEDLQPRVLTFEAARGQLTELTWCLVQGRSLSPAQQHELLEIVFVGLIASNWQLPEEILAGDTYRNKCAKEPWRKLEPKAK